MKKIHIEELKKKDLRSFWSEVRVLQDKYLIPDYRLEGHLVHISQLEDCPSDTHEIISCPGPHGELINVCVLKGKGCPKPSDKDNE